MDTRNKKGEAVPARRAVRALAMVIVAAGLLLVCVWQIRAFMASRPLAPPQIAAPQIAAPAQPPVMQAVQAPTPVPNATPPERKAALKQLKAFARKNPKDFPNYVTSLALGLDGSVWVAAEDGLWRYQTDGSRTRYTTADGLGDECLYAVAVD